MLFCGVNDSLKRDFDWFLDHRARLVSEHRGKHIVIRNQKVIGAYESDEQAVREAMKLFPIGTFLVQECSDDEQSYSRTFHSRVAFA